VRTEIGIEVTEDSNANGVAHGLIVLEHVPAICSLEVRRLVRRNQAPLRLRSGQALALLGMTCGGDNATVGRMFLEPVRESMESVETEERQRGPTPDHQCALPAKRAGDIALTAPRDEKG
jgi:hypothetical protein